MNLNDQGRILLNRAQRDVGRGATHGKVVARLSFGFWQYLTPRARESTLWTPYLHKAFPKGTPRNEVAALLESAVSLRNRLAHLEPVSSTSANVATKLSDVNRLFQLVAPEVHRWITHQSDLLDIIDRAPVPGLLTAQAPETP